MERLLGEVEGLAAKAVKRIITSQILPEEGTSEWIDLLRFIAIQRGRTPGAAREQQVMTTKITREILSEPGPGYQPPAREVIDQIEVTTKLGEVKSLQMDTSLMPQLHDLADLLVENDTELDFVLPDIGVVFHNEWAREYPGGVEGVSSQGLQILLPLSPRYILIKFDWQVYAAYHRSTIRVRNLDDIRAINRLMIANSEHNAYFSGRTPTRDMLSRWDEHIRSPRSSRVRVRKLREIGGRGTAVLHYTESVNASLGLSFLPQHLRAMLVPLQIRGDMYRWRSMQAPRIGGKALPPPEQTYPKWVREGRYSVESVK